MRQLILVKKEHPLTLNMPKIESSEHSAGIGGGAHYVIK